MIEGFGRMLRVSVSYALYFALYIFVFLGRVPRYLKRHKRARQALEGVLLLVFAGMIGYSFLLAAPASFPEQTLVAVKKGATLEEVASDLKQQGVIGSATLFELVARIFKGGVVVAGEYALTSPQNVLTMASRITSGDFELVPVKVRVEEGMSAEDITALLKKSVPGFDASGFYALAAPEEGKLYPDTYFILPGEEPALVVFAMTSDFNQHIREVEVASAIAAFGKPLPQVLTMASILEKEAATTQDRRIIAGILWHRIDIGMKLQVDATFSYINGKNSFTLTKADLATDSPYNTYLYKGLPPGPIGSPSIDAIMAAVTPVETSYLYYLSDLNGTVHYSTTYDQHLNKKEQYLDN
ncbi:MAG TPA: endolytic transglycosylase MltG [Candidatus Paceibacterota bacterium]|nr:endolytic transglycosylase MltG [Candidatus Paceibacterota bacterium]